MQDELEHFVRNDVWSLVYRPEDIPMLLGQSGFSRINQMLLETLPETKQG